MRWKALLLDVDGTLCFRGRLIPGADEAVAQFRRRGLLLRFTTNIDSRPPESVAAQLNAMGLEVLWNTGPRAGEAFPRVLCPAPRGPGWNPARWRWLGMTPPATWPEPVPWVPALFR